MVMIFGCDETITIVEPETGIAYIKYIQSSSISPALDWTYFNPRTYTLHDVAFSVGYRTSDGYWQFDSGPTDFRFYKAEDITPSATLNYNFDFNKAYTVITYDEGNGLSADVLVVRDTIITETNLGKSLVRFINLSTDIDEFNVHEETLGTLASFSAKGVPTEYIELDPGSYLFDAMNANGGERLTNSDSLAFTGGLTYKIIFSGSALATTPTELNAQIYAEY